MIQPYNSFCKSSQILQLFNACSLPGIEGDRSDEGIADGLDLISVGSNFLVEVSLVLEGIEVDVSVVQGFVGEVVCIKLNTLDEDLVASVVEDLLNCIPVLVCGTA